MQKFNKMNKDNTQLFDFNDILIEPALLSDIRSRSEINTRTVMDNLPLMTAPMDTVISEDNFHLFKNQGESSYWSNDIEKYPEKYGYTFKNNSNWVSNTGMSKEQAIEMNIKFRQKMREGGRNKSTWLTKWRLQNLEIGADKYSQMAQSEINIAIDQYIEQYIQKF
jgi:hypothetical protein